MNICHLGSPCLLFLTILTSLSSLELCAQATEIATLRVVQYNTKELNSEKIAAQHKNPQIEKIARIIESLSPSILSLNEIQYDSIGVPSPKFRTTGKNADALADLLQFPVNDSYMNFVMANTGANSIPWAGQNYLTEPNSPEAAQVHDRENFGVFPGQYSTLMLGKIPVVKKWNRTDLELLEIFPDFPLAKYRDFDGNHYAANLSLFDKSLSVIDVMVGNKKLKVILLHAVPINDFGVKDSINLARNTYQCAFLEWLITGKTKFPMNTSHLDIEPLEADEPFVVLGDLNFDIDSQELAEIDHPLRRLSRNPKLWMNRGMITYESSDLTFQRYHSQLDYIIAGGGVQVIEAGVYRPEPKFKDLGCHAQQPESKNKEAAIVVYKTQKKKKCYGEFSKAYMDAKLASDHFPIWADIRVP